jgi:uncharacterized membrane protein YqjE
MTKVRGTQETRETGEHGPDGRLADKSLGELVAIATGSISRLVKAEIELAKLELRADAKRAGYGAVLFVLAALTLGMVLILGSIGVAYVFVSLGLPNWGAFFIVAGLYFALAVIMVGIGVLRMRRISGLKRTRRTVGDDLAMLKRSGDDSGDKPALTE